MVAADVRRRIWGEKSTPASLPRRLHPKGAFLNSSWIRAVAKVWGLDAGALFLLYAREKLVNYQTSKAAANRGLEQTLQKGSMKTLKLFVPLVLGALCLTARPAHAAD